MNPAARRAVVAQHLGLERRAIRRRLVQHPLYVRDRQERLAAQVLEHVALLEPRLLRERVFLHG